MIIENIITNFRDESSGSFYILWSQEHLQFTVCRYTIDCEEETHLSSDNMISWFRVEVLSGVVQIQAIKVHKL